MKSVFELVQIFLLKIKFYMCVCGVGWGVIKYGPEQTFLFNLLCNNILEVACIRSKRDTLFFMCLKERPRLSFRVKERYIPISYIL